MIVSIRACPLIFLLRVEISVLDYAKLVLGKSGATNNEKQAMGSIYYYYVAADAYAKAQANTNA